MMETQFTPVSALLGGSLIGLSSVLLMATHGRIAGISGIVSGLLSNESGWRWTFLAGLVVAPVIAFVIWGATVGQGLSANVPLLAVAGALTGFGAVFGGGCTSGHGVCGLSRFSARSLVAVATFMVTAAITVFVVRHVL